MARTSNTPTNATAPQVDPVKPADDLTSNNATPSPEAERAAKNGSLTTNPAPAPVGEHEGEPGVDFAVPGADPSNVQMVSIKTTGDFMQLDPYTGKAFTKDTAVETPLTAFVQLGLDEKRLVKA